MSGAAGASRRGESFALVPNVGAEEGADWPRFAGLAAVRDTVALWRLLFPAGHRVIGPVATHPLAWPEALGPEPPRAAFAWLDARPGGWAWLADETARAIAGGNSWAGPSPDATCRVHDKAFAAQVADAAGLVPPPLRDRTFVLDAETLRESPVGLAAIEALLASWPPGFDEFVLKPRFSSSGRGSLRGHRTALDRARIRGALPRLAARGGALLEPWLERTADLSVSFHIAPPPARGDEEVTLLGSLEQLVTRAGVPLGHFGEVDERGRIHCGSRHDADLREAARTLARAGARAGYFGPGGIDGLAFRPDAGSAVRGDVLRPVVELNARFTLGVVAIGIVHRLLAAGAAGHGPVVPGEPFVFLLRLRIPRGHADWPAAARALGAGVRGLALAADPRGPGALVARDRRALAPLLEAGAADGPGTP